ncbi:MAG TPA: CBS domain-containing protein [Nitrososphaerales archaeon]|nr:CBS domain-containing protein [Nitrososphaerales archaeon]
MSLRESLSHPVSDYMSAAFARVAVTGSVDEAARTMQKAGATEAVVVSGSVPQGVVTERDILYKVVAAGSNPSMVKVGDIMSSPVQTIDVASNVGEAIAKMSKLGIRRLGVTKNGEIVGVVTQKAMVAGRVEQNVPLPELAHPEHLSCPYCNAALDSKEELSKHIDRVHMGGLGLLEGDTSKW